MTWVQSSESDRRVNSLKLFWSQYDFNIHKIDIRYKLKKEFKRFLISTGDANKGASTPALKLCPSTHYLQCFRPSEGQGVVAFKTQILLPRWGPRVSGPCYFIFRVCLWRCTRVLMPVKRGQRTSGVITQVPPTLFLDAGCLTDRGLTNSAAPTSQ